MNAPRPPWSDEQTSARLPSPASKAHADRAAPWKEATRELDLERLPLTFDINPGETAMLGVRWLLLAAGAALLLLGGWAWLIAGDETELVEKVLATVLLPGMLAGLALWIWLVHRGTPRRQRLMLWRDRVRYEDPVGSWEQRTRDYVGLALRQRQTRKAQRGSQRRSYSAAERELRMDRDVWLWWIELVHEDPARDLVLWASDGDFASSDGLELVGRMSETFGLPVLSTSGLREATTEDERRLAERVSPWQAVARQLRRKSNGLPSQHDRSS
jgi:hypothetical protein